MSTMVRAIAPVVKGSFEGTLTIMSPRVTAPRITVSAPSTGPLPATMWSWREP